MEIKNQTNGEAELTGYLGEVWQEMANKLHLNFTIVEGYQYGIMEPNGNWTGMIGMLHRNEAEMAVADFTPTQSRSQVVDFAMAFLTDRYVVNTLSTYFC